MPRDRDLAATTTWGGWQPQSHDRHLVARQRAGLVAADHGGGAQRLHRRQPPDDGAPRRHALHAHGQRDGHRHRQAFGHHRHHLADGHHQHLGQRQVAPQAQQHHQREQTQRRSHQPAAELLDAPLQRRLRLLGAFGQAGDAADFGVRAGGHHHRAGAPRRDVGSRIDHVVAVGQAGGFGQRRQRLAHRHRFAGQRGLGHLQLGLLDQSRVGAHGVTGGQQQDVARDQLACLQQRLVAVAQGAHAHAGQAAQGGHGTLGAAFLEGADERVDDDHRQDHRGVAVVAQRHRQHRGHEQDVDQRALELLCQCAPQRPRRRCGQGVRAAFGGTLPHRRRRQSLRGMAADALNGLTGVTGVPGS